MEGFILSSNGETQKKAALAASEVFIDSKDIEWEDLGGGLQRQMLGYNPDLMMVKVRFEKGAIGQPHAHHHRQVTYVEQGAFEVHINGKKQVLRAGDSFFVPAEAVHGCVALEPGVLLDVFTPFRDEFLNGQEK